MWKSGKQKLSYLRHFKAIHVFHLRQIPIEKMQLHAPPLCQICFEEANKSGETEENDDPESFEIGDFVIYSPEN